MHNIIILTHTYIIVHSNWPIRFISWMWLFLLEVCHRMINKTFKITNQTLVQWDYSSTLYSCNFIAWHIYSYETIYKQKFWLMSSALWVSVWSSYYYYFLSVWLDLHFELIIENWARKAIDIWKLSPTLWTGRVPQNYFNWPEQSQSNTENKGLLLLHHLVRSARFELPLGLWPSVV